MDTVTRKVVSTVYGMVAEAYGYRTDAERFTDIPCGECGGDGCVACEFTGVEE